jgi:2'-5' RNA ligase
LPPGWATAPSPSVQGPGGRAVGQFDCPPSATLLQVRSFVAVWPPEEVLDALAALPRPGTGVLRWSRRDQWHVTLRFFGEIEPKAAERASAALAKVAGSFREPPRAVGGPATRFLGPGLIVWPVEGLSELARAVGRATAKLGKPLPQRRFTGHLTLARGHRGADLRSQSDLLASLSASWQVVSMSLVESHLGPHGARYETLAEFPFPSVGP